MVPGLKLALIMWNLHVNPRLDESPNAESWLAACVRDTVEVLTVSLKHSRYLVSALSSCEEGAIGFPARRIWSAA